MLGKFGEIWESLENIGKVWFPAGGKRGAKDQKWGAKDVPGTGIQLGAPATGRWDSREDWADGQVEFA